MICALDKEPSAVLNMAPYLKDKEPFSRICAVFTRTICDQYTLILHAHYSLVPGRRHTFFFHYLHNLLVLLRLLKFPMIGQHRAEPGVCNSPGTR